MSAIEIVTVTCTILGALLAIVTVCHQCRFPSRWWRWRESRMRDPERGGVGLGEGVVVRHEEEVVVEADVQGVPQPPSIPELTPVDLGLSFLPSAVSQQGAQDAEV
ncbi:uncharacterized protein BO80DRAFT_449727 [Aspergillus ibericus CBS 121593]|uniref:Uncharacterized protein n=1 Tax=Aspergillus ibericus CBS 121593 TaxID=1448316 RepID=A0A395GKL2_9EURO|nr:hypothetical protein BO80DRAFT_449727 [Aspergillus ibericus CBS 121593]RAK95999.1 hypothetical protein BO80DRAFT_449727 [Aspergillus ibericus CBS 121593]